MDDVYAGLHVNGHLGRGAMLAGNRVASTVPSSSVEPPYAPVPRVDGVAHDLKNMLMVVLSYIELSVSSLPDDDPIRVDLLEAASAAERAAELTRQLMAQGRKLVQHQEEFSLNTMLISMEKMLRRLVGEEVEFRFRLAGGLFSIRSDRCQLEQVVVNLVLNARDAMSNGGRVTLTTANEGLDAEKAAGLRVTPGNYVRLSIADTGCGMEPETLLRLFEPFFTTKGTQGTGLGLSMVFGTVRGNGGGISVESKPGLGTTFQLYLPSAESEN